MEIKFKSWAKTQTMPHYPLRTIWLVRQDMLCSMLMLKGQSIYPREQSAECPAGERWKDCPCHIPSSTCCTTSSGSGSGSGSGSTSGSASTWASASGATSTSTTSSWATGTQHAPNRREEGGCRRRPLMKTTDMTEPLETKSERLLSNTEDGYMRERQSCWRERNTWWWEKVSQPFTQKQYWTVEVETCPKRSQFVLILCRHIKDIAWNLL